MSTDRAAFDWIRRLVEERTGNVLDEQKTYLVNARLAPIVESEGVADVNSLVRQLQTGRHPDLEQSCVEVLLIHETSFFRDRHYFDELATQILPDLIEQRSSTRQLTVWCAACATGQEPYSLAMLIREQFPGLLDDWQLNFVATDLSQGAIAQAKQGSYSQVEIGRGLTPTRTTRFFRQSNGRWSATESLRKGIQFRVHNLLTDDPPLNNVDLVLIRNVLIYMSDGCRSQILQKVHRSMSSRSWLITGATETLFDQSSEFVRGEASIPAYRRVD
jgi:chemotaxis protein methyltransferase CheR